MNPDSDSQVAALKNQLFMQLVALIVISGTLTVFLFRQASVAGKDIDTVKPQAQQIINVYSQSQPAIVNFVNELVAYGEKHPEFLPVLKKNGLAPAPAAVKK